MGQTRICVNDNFNISPENVFLMLNWCWTHFRNTELSTLNDSSYLNINQCDKTYLILNNGNNQNNSNNNNNNLIRCFKFVLYIDSPGGSAFAFGEFSSFIL